MWPRGASAWLAGEPGDARRRISWPALRFDTASVSIEPANAVCQAALGRNRTRPRSLPLDGLREELPEATVGFEVAANHA